MLTASLCFCLFMFTPPPLGRRAPTASWVYSLNVVLLDLLTPPGSGLQWWRGQVRGARGSVAALLEGTLEGVVAPPTTRAGLGSAGSAAFFKKDVLNSPPDFKRNVLNLGFFLEQKNRRVF